MLRLCTKNAPAAVAIVFGSLAGCAGTTPTAEVVRDCRDRVVVEDTYAIQVKQAEWQDRVRPIGTESIPDDQLRRAGVDPYVWPKESFMVINVEIENVTNQPLTFGQLTLDNFVLIRGDAVTFTPEYELGTRSTLGDFNPGIPRDTTIIFDVPRGDYTLQLVRTNPSPVSRLPVYSLVFGPSTIHACRLGTTH
jgi:hypothetical protein